MIIGAQGYTIRDFCQDEEGIRSSLKKLREIGYKALQVSAFGQIEPERLRAMADEDGISIIITHTNPTLILEQTQAVIRAHKALGCRHVGIGSMPQKYLNGLAGLEAFLADYDRPARELAENGLKLHYHNHYYEYQREQGKLLIDWMAEKTAPELWGFILDVFWTQYGGRCPAHQVELLKGRIDVMHFKDLSIVGQERRTAPVMEGNLAWEELFEACRNAGVEYAMVEQDDTYGQDPFDELRISHDNLLRAGMEF